MNTVIRFTGRRETVTDVSAVTSTVLVTRFDGSVGLMISMVCFAGREFEFVIGGDNPLAKPSTSMRPAGLTSNLTVPVPIGAVVAHICLRQQTVGAGAVGTAATGAGSRCSRRRSGRWRRCRHRFRRRFASEPAGAAPTASASATAPAIWGAREGASPARAAAARSPRTSGSPLLPAGTGGLGPVRGAVSGSSHTCGLGKVTARLQTDVPTQRLAKSGHRLKAIVDVNRHRF